MSQYLFSPFDTRYNKDLPYTLSEEALLGAQVEVECAWLEALMDEGLCPEMDSAQLKSLVKDLGFAEIEEIEKRTQHATRALVEAIAQRLQQGGFPEQAKWVHVGLTSFDTVDTAQRLRLKNFFKTDFWPSLEAFKKELRRWGRDHQRTEQVGRTHGQWAVPTYFGLAFAEAHERVDAIETHLRHAVQELTGQATGAIGGYHAPALLVKDPLKLEKKFLAVLGLKRHLGAIQVLPPEDQVLVAQHLLSLSSVVAKLATDLRHLARSEIAEIAEGLKAGQVGSSTMPQKRNPWNLEHVCSLYKVMLSRVHLMELDMVTEHQRDLTNSASGRFYSESWALPFLMIKRLSSVLSRMEAYPEQMKKQMDEAGSRVMAEAFYVLLSKEGCVDAHDMVRQASRESETSQNDLLETLKDKGFLKTLHSLEELKEQVLEGSRLKFHEITKKWQAD